LRGTPDRPSDMNDAETARGRRHCHPILAGAPAAGYDTGHTGGRRLEAGSHKLIVRQMKIRAVGARSPRPGRKDHTPTRPKHHRDIL